MSEQEAIEKEEEFITQNYNSIANKVIKFKPSNLNREELITSFYYDETSPSCLRYRDEPDIKRLIKKRGKKHGDVAGYKDKGIIGELGLIRQHI